MDLEKNIKLKIPKHAEHISRGLWKWKNPRNKFTIVALHYSAHPLKNEEWYNENKPRISSIDWDREQEISPLASTRGHRIFNKFNPEVHMQNLMVKGKFNYNPELPILRVWDFGRVHPFVLWSQKNEKKQWLIFKEYMGHNIGLPDFITEVKPLTKLFFGDSVIEDYCDPKSATQHSDKSEYTSVELLQAQDIHSDFISFPIRYGINLIDLLITSVTVDNEPMLIVDSNNCPIIIDGFTGGFIWDKKGQTPEQDGFYEHALDTVRYTVTNVFTYDEVLEKNTGEQLESKKSKSQGMDYYNQRLVEKLDKELSVRINRLKGTREVEIET